jgi:hypothetical protein
VGDTRRPRSLTIVGLSEPLNGVGLHYGAAISEAPALAGQDVSVVGGITEIDGTDNIYVEYRVEVVGGSGEGRLETIDLY